MKLWPTKKGGDGSTGMGVTGKIQIMCGVVKLDREVFELPTPGGCSCAAMSYKEKFYHG